MKDLYIISYEPDGEGAPYFFELSWVPDLPTFHYPTENPETGALSPHYQAKANVLELSADWLPDHFLASKKFLAVCDSCECEYVSRAVELTIEEGREPSREYYFFAVTERIRAMDLEKSSFVIDSNAKIENADIQNPNYECIDKLVISTNVDADLFYFEEIHEVVCSGRFLTECVNRKIHGLTFKKIDDDYRYAPWEDF
ncbi:hypothetical protein IMW75_22250 [Pseudomonas gregormendelii]|uniref:Immunity MXAN-0049 protein domain-containing protein n=1 Tax=Pseudomonas gregormendelii TaxID=1628277 RepID=A0ABS3AM37_9PSED|nr:DUF1629 domain-containing protein [Pseudomonas gregormendelii]MBN3967987.1 hypothetical protein [Pseudomonas gregormendelii]